MPFGYGLWIWFKGNPIAQWAAGIGVAYVLFRIWLAKKIGGERKEAATEARKEVIQQIEEQTDDAIQRVEDDRRATADLNDEQLRQRIEASPYNRGRLHRPEAD